jgi:hypothetical protein
MCLFGFVTALAIPPSESMVETVQMVELSAYILKYSLLSRKKGCVSGVVWIGADEILSHPWFREWTKVVSTA